MRKNFIKKHYKAVRNMVCVLAIGISVVGTSSMVYSDTRQGGLDDSIELLQKEGLLEQAIADGYVSPEAAARAGITGGNTSAEPAAPAEQSAPAEQAAPAETSSGSDSSSGGSQPAQASSSGSTQTATKEPKKQEKKKEVVITESDVSGKFVVTTAVELYDSNKKNNKVASLEAGTTVDVTAETSNGLFKTGDGYYFDKTKCVTSDVWENGWQETERTDATCTEAGSVTYNNANNTDITKTEEIPALGHSYEVTDTKEPTCTDKGSTTYTCSVCGDTYTEEADALGHQKGDWTVTKEPGLFSKGEKVIKCTVCGEVLETEEIAQTCPLPLAAVIAIGAGVIALIVGIVVVLIKKRVIRLRHRHHRVR